MNADAPQGNSTGNKRSREASPNNKKDVVKDVDDTNMARILAAISGLTNSTNEMKTQFGGHIVGFGDECVVNFWILRTKI